MYFERVPSCSISLSGLLSDHVVFFFCGTTDRCSFKASKIFCLFFSPDDRTTQAKTANWFVGASLCDCVNEQSDDEQLQDIKIL